MPIPDLGPRSTVIQQLRAAQARGFMQRLAESLRRGRKKPGGEAGEAVPVKPGRPLDLSGGAAAPLKFDD